MRAVVYDRYGPPEVLRLEDVERPAPPPEDKVLVKIHATTVNRLDSGTREANRLEADVTAVCNTKNVETVRSLGADRVIDYTQEDFPKNGETYDVIFDAVGKHSFGRCKSSLKRRGRYLATDGFWNLILAPWTWLFRGKRVVFQIPPQYAKKDVLFLKELIEAGKYRPVVDRSYPLEQVVEATRNVETEQNTGNVVLTVGGDRGA